MRLPRVPTYLLAALVLLLGGGVAEAGPPSVKKALRALIEDTRARQGTSHRSLAVVALVVKQHDDATGPVFSTKGLAWHKLASGRIEVDARGVAEDRVLPSGLLHGLDSDQRLLAAPLLLTVGTKAAPKWVRAPGQVEPGDDPVLGVVGPEMRHVLALAPHQEAIRDLLALERRLAGLEGPGTPLSSLAIRDAPRIRKPREAASKALAPLPRSYGGAICGHVAFLGNRPIEIVLARDPALYAAYGTAAIDGIATYLALWEELYGRAGLPPEQKTNWPRLLEEATKILQDIAKARVSKTEEASRRRLHARGASRLGWVLVGEEGEVRLLEAWPLGDAGPFPIPAREPGGKPVNESPNCILGGTPTLEYLERYVERLKELRRKMGDL
jgi:hypothetical protein